MIGSSVLGGLVFWMSDSMVFRCIWCFDQNFRNLLTSNLISSIRARFYSSRAFQRAQKHPKRMRNEGDMVISKSEHEWKKKGRENFFLHVGPTVLYNGARSSSHGVGPSPISLPHGTQRGGVIIPPPSLLEAAWDATGGRGGFRHLSLPRSPPSPLRNFLPRRVGRSRSWSGLWHTIRSKSRSRSGLGPPRSRSGSVLTSVSLLTMNMRTWKEINVSTSINKKKLESKTLAMILADLRSM